jgi:transcriptional regulator with XRE-family HTH domain
VDVVRFGLAMRALRHRRRWTQQRLADAIGVSRQVIGRIEGGQADRVAVHTLIRTASALGATLSVKLLWHGEGLDRLLDAAHADMTERVLRLIQDLGWVASTEVSFNIRGDRGTIDLLAFHASTGSLLVIEIKSVVPDLQTMLGTLDRKVRIAPDVARERGWQVRSVSRLLVLPDDRTSRRRVERHSGTFDTTFPARTADVRRWLRDPDGRLAGILFLPNAPHTGTRQRVAPARNPSNTRARTNRPNCQSPR